MFHVAVYLQIRSTSFDGMCAWARMRSAQHTCRRPVTRPHRKGPSPEMEPGPLKSAKPRLLRN